MVTLNHTSGTNADHAAVPVLAGDHQRVGVLPLGSRVNLAVDFFEDALLLELSVAVELAEAHRHLAGAGSVALGEKLDDALGHVHASSGVQTGGNAKGDVASAQGAGAIQLADGEQRSQSGVPRIAQAFQSEFGEHPVLTNERDSVGNSSDSDYL